MCGIVGLFTKDLRLEPELGRLMAAMLTTMTDRGPTRPGLRSMASGSRVA